MLQCSLLVGLVVVLFVTTANSSVWDGRTPQFEDVNILLPPKMTHPVEYHLRATHGCFRWSWTHGDVLSVLPDYHGGSCAVSARLRSIAPYSGRKEAVVDAADVHTGIVIHIKVYIDIFSRLQLLYNSVELDLDSVAMLCVYAFDSQGNVFSSLVGIRFMWQLIPETNGSPHHLLHVPLRDSPLSHYHGDFGDLGIQILLEDNGAFSDVFVVRGIRIGHEVVSVHLLEPQFDHIGDKIDLTVVEARSQDTPSPVLGPIGALVQNNRKVIRGNLPQDVCIHWLNHNLLRVRSLLKEGSGIGGRAQYEVKVLKAKHFMEKLIFTLPDIGQRVELEVKYGSDDKSASEKDAHFTALLVLWFVLFLVIVVVLCYAAHALEPRPNTPDDNKQPKTDHTPDDNRRRFMEYVKSTIHETPYYRQEAKRRLGPLRW